MSDWYNDYDNVVTMAGLLAQHGADGHLVAGFVEKPWKWTREWEDRDGHDDNWCNGILDCERKECDVCHDRYPECQIRVVNHEYKRDEWEEFDACPTCREEKPWTQRGWGKADF